MKKAVIVSAVRTPVGKAKRGVTTFVRPDDMAALALKGALAQAGNVNPAEIDDVILGCAMPEAEQGMNVARIASFRAGLPYEVPGMTINRFCSSGLQSVAIAMDRIKAGGAQAILAGGTESMSMVPMGGLKPAPNPTLMNENPGTYTGMGITAENVATKYNVSREDQDAFALASHQKAAAATAAGYFAKEIIPIPLGGDQFLSVDEHIRPDTTLDGLAKLKPAFRLGGSVTAGNSSPLSDGAAAALITSEEFAKERGLPILGEFTHYSVVGLDPEFMGMGPLYAIRKLWAAAGITDADVDLYEINEAFAAQAVPCVRELGIDPSKVNVNGGAIALGHPLGCTGGKLIATLLNTMARTGAKTGVVSMCIGGGMGAAGLFRRYDG